MLRLTLLFLLFVSVLHAQFYINQIVQVTSGTDMSGVTAINSTFYIKFGITMLVTGTFTNCYFELIAGTITFTGTFNNVGFQFQGCNVIFQGGSLSSNNFTIYDSAQVSMSINNPITIGTLNLFGSSLTLPTTFNISKVNLKEASLLRSSHSGNISLMLCDGGELSLNQNVFIDNFDYTGFYPLWLTVSLNISHAYINSKLELHIPAGITADFGECFGFDFLSVQGDGRFITSYMHVEDCEISNFVFRAGNGYFTRESKYMLTILNSADISDNTITNTASVVNQGNTNFHGITRLKTTIKNTGNMKFTSLTAFSADKITTINNVNNLTIFADTIGPIHPFPPIINNGSMYLASYDAFLEILSLTQNGITTIITGQVILNNVLSCAGNFFLGDGTVLFLNGTFGNYVSFMCRVTGKGVLKITGTVYLNRSIIEVPIINV